MWRYLRDLSELSAAMTPEEIKIANDWYAKLGPYEADVWRGAYRIEWYWEALNAARRKSDLERRLAG